MAKKKSRKAPRESAAQKRDKVPGQPPKNMGARGWSNAQKRQTRMKRYGEK